MNEITQVTEVEMAVAPVIVFNDATGEFEAVTETVVTDEGPVANEADVTIH